jgi:hypothetical protein
LESTHTNQINLPFVLEPDIPYFCFFLALILAIAFGVARHVEVQLLTLD